VSEWFIEPVSKTGVPLAGTAGSNPALSVEDNHVLKLTDGPFKNARMKVENAKLCNPDVVGMAVSIRLLFPTTTYNTVTYVDSRR
jgi:hypothetical protein